MHRNHPFIRSMVLEVRERLQAILELSEGGSTQDGGQVIIEKLTDISECLANVEYAATVRSRYLADGRLVDSAE